MFHRPAVFLDRDGVLIEERHYLSDPNQVALTADVAPALRRLNEAGIPVVVVTNQAGVARGYFSLEDVSAVHKRIEARLAGEGARIDRFYCCPHHPTEGVGAFRVDCACRKPKPGMLLEAASEMLLDLERSYLVGDKKIDLEAGAAAGCRNFLVRTGHGREVEVSPDDVAILQIAGIMPNAAAAIERILLDLAEC